MKQIETTLKRFLSQAQCNLVYCFWRRRRIWFPLLRTIIHMTDGILEQMHCLVRVFPTFT